MWPFSDRRIAEREFRRLVVRVPNPVGDQVMATPALDAVRARYPDTHITLHGNRNARELYDGAEYFDEFLLHEPDLGFRAQARVLKPLGFDACLLLTGSLTTAIPPFLARIKHRIGYRWSGRTPLLTAHFRAHKTPYPTKHAYLELVAKLGAEGGGPVRLPLTDETRSRFGGWAEARGIEDEEQLLVLGVGAAFGPSKLWPAEHFAAVADHMHERFGARVVVLCAPGEEAIGDAVRAGARHPLTDTGQHPVHMGMLKALVARSRLVLTNDAGPRHLAAAFGIKSVCLMGPNHPAFTETDMELQTVLRNPVSCQPCRLKVCPVEGHPCLRDLVPERVIEVVENLWQN